MTHVRLQGDTAVQIFAAAFLKTFQTALYISGYVLFAAVFLSILTPQEAFISTILDGSIMRPLALGFLAIVAISTANGLVRATLAAFRVRATLTLFRAARYKF
jgi:hypothetical protein